jgi:hypothetical protein
LHPGSERAASGERKAPGTTVMTPGVGRQLSQDIARAVAAEVSLQLGRVRVVSGAGAKDDAALLETALIFGGAILRNACANQRADKCATFLSSLGASARIVRLLPATP